MVLRYAIPVAPITNRYIEYSMYNVKQRFEKIAGDKPRLSSYMAFAEAVSDTGVSEDIIRRWFRKLVDTDDYAKNETRGVIRHLVKLAKPSK